MSKNKSRKNLIDWALCPSSEILLCGPTKKSDMDSSVRQTRYVIYNDGELADLQRVAVVDGRGVGGSLLWANLVGSVYLGDGTVRQIPCGDASYFAKVILAMRYRLQSLCRAFREDIDGNKIAAAYKIVSDAPTVYRNVNKRRSYSVGGNGNASVYIEPLEPVHSFIRTSPDNMLSVNAAENTILFNLLSDIYARQSR